MAVGVPENVTEVGSVRISVLLGQNGLGTSFSIDGLEMEAALGYLISVEEQLRHRIACQWAQSEVDDDIEAGICPICGQDVEDDDESE